MELQKWFIFTFYLIVKSNCINCPINQCYSNDQNKCLDIILNNFTGISIYGLCVANRQQSQIQYCAVIQKQICLNQAQTMCVLLNQNPNDNFIGNYLNDSEIQICIEQSDIQISTMRLQSIQAIQDGYCLQDDNLIYPYQHPANSFQCQCKKDECYDGQQCKVMDENINVGKNHFGNCVTINQIDDIKVCYNDGLKICLLQTSQSSSQCVQYSSNSQVIGVYSVKSINFCIQISMIDQQLPPNSSIIQLKTDYCFYKQNSITKINDLSKNIVGLTKISSCVLQNISVDQSDEILSCISGYCISGQDCIQMNGINIISKRQNNQCGGDSENNFLECFANFQTQPQVCIQNNSCELLTQQKPFVGVKNGKECMLQGDYFLSQGQKVYCSKYYCIESFNITFPIQVGNQTISQTLTLQRCQQEDVNLGQDSNGNCQASNKKLCFSDSTCLYTDPISNIQSCKNLSPNKLFPYFSRENNTTNCLPFQQISGIGQDIEKCPEGFCIYSISSTKKYCLSLGSFVQGQFQIGIEAITQNCLTPFQPSYLGIQYCQSNQFCLIEQEKLQICHPLMETSTYLRNRPDVKAKGKDGRCHDLNEPNSVSCLSGDYCLLLDTCVKLSSSNPQTIGRSTDQSCIPINTLLATNCAQGFCLKNNQCIPLSPLFPGRESNTENCLTENQSENYGAQSCYSEFCLLLGTPAIFNKCVSLDYQNPNQIGIYLNTGICVSLSDENIPPNSQPIVFFLMKIYIKTVFIKKKQCFSGVYCISSNQNGEFCLKVEGDIKCSDILGKCVLQSSNTQCYRCPFNQCLSNGNCIPLDNKYCQDSNCLDINSFGCQVCPQGFCFQKQAQTCLHYSQIDTSQYSKNECILIYRQDMQCFKQDINQTNKFNVNLCKDYNNLCQIIQQSNQIYPCLICPIYFINPGNDVCFQQISQTPNGYFNLELIYIKEDCFPKSDCSNGSIKCPEGCRNCKDQNTCTQCIENYFLYNDQQSQKQMCVQCDSSKYDYQLDPSSKLSSYVTKIEFYCAECNKQQNQWADSSYQDKICTQFVVDVGGTKKFSSTFSQTLYYTTQYGKTQSISFSQSQKLFKSIIQLIKSKQPNTCSGVCLRCIKDTQGNSKCLKCQQFYYVTPNYQCQKCPKGCLECGMSIIGQNFELQNYENLSYEEQINGQFNFQNSIFTCRYCQQGLMISQDLSSCISCGNGCQSCTLQEQSGNYVNSKRYGFNVYPGQILNRYCLSCIDGYILDYLNRFDCIYQFQNKCLDFDLVKNEQSNSKTYFQQRAYSTDKIRIRCFNCDYNACLYNGNCMSFQNTFSTNSVICQTVYFKNYYYDSLGNVDCFKSYKGYYPQVNYCNDYVPIKMTESNNQCDQYKSCSLLIQNCINCIEFSQYPDGLLYQCIKCEYGYIPSISGCIACPDSCLSCFEAGYYQNERVNFTNIFTHERQILQSLTLQQRINYLQNFQITMLCSSCKDGRQLNSTQTSCDLPNCGKYCSKCVFYLDEPLCIQCSNTLLFNEISSIQLYIASMYFNSIYLDNIQQMITYDQPQRNCKLCPMLCETCEDKDIYFSLDAFDLYQMKCFTCKQQILSNYQELQRYEIRYDKQKQKCQLCLINDNGCYFKKQSYIYAYCGDYSQPLGLGTQEKPINLFRMSQLNINQVLLNDPNLQRAYVFYNELQLREIELIIEYIGTNNICIENVQFQLETNIKTKIFSLDYLSLKIRANQTQDGKNFLIYQISPGLIKGFNKVTIENIDITQRNMQAQFGYLIENASIDMLTITNSSFSQIFSSPNYFTFNVKYLNGTMVMNNVSFNNITISNSNFFNIQFYYPSYSLRYQIQDLFINNCSLEQSYLLQFEQQGSIFIQNIQILNTNLTNKSVLIQAYLNSQQTSLSTLEINYFTQNNSNIFDYSSLIRTLNFKQISLNNLLIFNNSIITKQQNQNSILFYIDCLNIENFIFMNNILQNTIIISLSSQNFLQRYSGVYNFITFKFLQNEIITQNSIVFKLNIYQNVVINISDILIQSNKFNPLNQQDLKNNRYFYFYQITDLIINNVQIYDQQIVQFIQNQLTQTININQLIVGQLLSKSPSFNILEFQGVNNTCTIQNSSLRNLISSDTLIQIEQIQNKQAYKDNLSHKILLQNITLQEIELQIISAFDKIQAQSLLSINSKVQGNIQVNNLIVLNASRQASQPQDLNNSMYQITTFIMIDSPIGYVDIQNNTIISPQAHPQNNMLQICSFYLNITNSTYLIKENNILVQSDPSIKGGIALINSQQVYISNSIFNGGTAIQGGAIYWKPTNSPTILIDKSLFLNNLSTGKVYVEECYGGAIFLDISSVQLGLEIFIQNTNFENNISLSMGGSIYIAQSLSKYFLIIKNTNFTDNMSLLGSILYTKQSRFQSQILFQLINAKQTNAIIHFSQQIELLVKQSKLSNKQFSQFFIQNHDLLDVVKCTFISTKQEFTNDNQFIQQLSYQSLFDIQDVNNLTFVSNSYKQFKVYNILMAIQNSQKLQIQYDEFSYNTILKQQKISYANTQISLIAINSNVAIIKQIKYIFNSCQICGDGSMSINSTHLLIQDSLFQQNLALNGGSLYLNIPKKINFSRFLVQDQTFLDYVIQYSQSNQTIQNCQFIQNTALLNGGSIFVGDSNLYIIQSNFIQNQAFKYGGAIASNGKNENNIDNINLVYSKFIVNNALVGSVFFQLQNLPIQRLLQNQLTNNKAKLYGNSLVQPATGYIGTQEGKQYQNSLTIKNFTSGQLQKNIQIQLINNDEETITELQDAIVLHFETDQLDSTIIPNQIQQKSGIFNLKDVLQVYSKLGSVVKIKVYSNYNYFPVYDLQGNFIQTQQAEPFYLNFQFISLCPQGTTLVQDKVKRDLCYKCPDGTFNLQEGSKCFKCPFECSSTQMFLPQRYWRSSLANYNYYNCIIPLNCIGDIGRQIPFFLQSSSNRYCSEGNIGIECLDCDLEGLIWQQSYFQIIPYKCQKCGIQQNIASLVIFILNIAFYSFLIIQFNKIYLFLKVKKVFQLLNVRISFSLNLFYQLKTIIEYFQLIIILSPLMYQLPSQLQQLIIEFSNFAQNILKIFDCKLSDSLSSTLLPYQYFRIIIALAFHFTMIFVIYIILKLRKANNNLIKNTFLYFQLLSTPYFFKLLIGVTTFISLEDQLYVKDFPSQVWSISDIGVIICLILIFIQVLSIVKINMYLQRYDNQLNHFLQFACKSNKFCWWESFSIAYRMLLYLIDSLYYQQLAIKSSILCTICLSYCISIFYFMPYKQKIQNFIEIAKNFGFSICFGIMNFLEQNVTKDKTVIVIYIVQAIYILLFLFNSLKSLVLKIIKRLFEKQKNSMENRFKYWKKLKHAFKVNPKQQIHVLKNLEKKNYENIQFNYQKFMLIKKRQTFQFESISKS
ncbi:hypothetical protein ABPG72_015967 [Tetrahymena utriculariae]